MKFTLLAAVMAKFCTAKKFNFSHFCWNPYILLSYTHYGRFE